VPERLFSRAGASSTFGSVSITLSPLWLSAEHDARFGGFRRG